MPIDPANSPLPGGREQRGAGNYSGEEPKDKRTPQGVRLKSERRSETHRHSEEDGQCFSENGRNIHRVKGTKDKAIA